MPSDRVRSWGPEAVRRTLAGAVASCIAALVFTACGGPGTGPTPPPPPPPPPPPVNVAPQIKSLVSSDLRAEVDVPITLTASVEDAETPPASLTYTWTADVGTFSGTGPTVTWVAGQTATTPADVVLTLTVTERYTSGSTPAENKASSTTTVRLNNSPKELREMSVRFLTDFANSKVSPEQCVSEFSDSCRGKRDELEDVQDIRHDYEHISSTIRPTSLTINGARTSATVHTFCSFTVKVITTQPRDEPCQNGKCPLGSIGSSTGDCWTTNVYERGRWWLCESHFSPIPSLATPSTFTPTFFRRSGS
jgi:hypothetical protein